MQRASCMYGAKFLHVSREAHTELMTKVNCAQLLEGAPNHQIAGNTRRKDQRLLGKARLWGVEDQHGLRRARHKGPANCQAECAAGAAHIPVRRRSAQSVLLAC